MTSPGSREARSRARARRWVGLLGLAVLVVGLWWLRDPLLGVLTTFVGWTEGLGAWAPWVLGASYVLAILLLAPVTPLVLACGYLLGVVQGFFVAFLAHSLATFTAFLLGRHLLRDRIQARISGSRHLRAVDRALADGGLTSLILLRASPVLPTWLLSYGLGVTSARTGFYAVASLAVSPFILAGVVAGQALEDLTSLGEAGPRGPGSLALLIAGLIATLGVSAWLGWRAKRLLEVPEPGTGAAKATD